MQEMKRTTKPGEVSKNRKRHTLTAGQKQKIFVEEYLIDLNASRAARAAGYSPKTAGVIGHDLLKNPKIRDQIAKAMQKRAERTQVTQDRVVKELARIAFSDIRSFVRWSGQGVEILPSYTLTDDDAACVSEVSQVDTQYGTTIKFKLHDKKSALEMLGRHLGMFVEKHKHTVEGREGGPISVEHSFTDEAIKKAYDLLYRG